MNAEISHLETPENRFDFPSQCPREGYVGHAGFISLPKELSDDVHGWIFGASLTSGECAAAIDRVVLAPLFDGLAAQGGYFSITGVSSYADHKTLTSETDFNLLTAPSFEATDYTLYFDPPYKTNGPRIDLKLHH